MRTENLKPARAVSPGAVLRRELDARGWSQKDLAEIMGRPEQAISEIAQGAKRITPETALELGEALGTSADLWLNLESNYRLRVAERGRGSAAREKTIGKRAKAYRLVPVRELAKRGWIQLGESAESLERAVCAFLGIASLDQEPVLAASFRHSQARRPEPGPQLAWVKRVEAVARGGRAPFSRAALEKAMPRILECARRREDAPRALDIVASLGVRVAVVPHLPQSYVDGVAFFSDARPVLGLSLRYDRLDAFWFNLTHELAHIVSGDKIAHLDVADPDAGPDRVESAANRRAADWLIPPERYREFVEAQRGNFPAAAVQAVAVEMNRHPGIIVGRLQHEGLLPYKNLRGMLVPVRHQLGDWVDA
jgi:HTH-type transcriptional regulator/antitoxin HigA